MILELQGHKWEAIEIKTQVSISYLKDVWNPLDDFKL
jgi:hypothetical protein